MSRSQVLSQLRKQGGFSLVEIMIVGGIMSVMALGIATVMVNSQRSAQSVSAKTDFNSLVTLLQSVFNNTESCLKALSDETLDPLPKSGIKLNVGGSVVQEGKYGSSLRISKLELGAKEATGATNQYIVPLVLTADRSIGGTETAVGGSTLTHTFRLNVTLDGSNKVKQCSGIVTNYWVGVKNSTDITYLDGNVGVGTTAPATKFDVEGTAQATMFLYKSDLRLKKNVREIPNALDRVLQLHGVLYDWKNKAHLSKSNDQLGFIAQEVEQIFPEAVNTSPDTGIKSVAYGNLIAPIIEAMKQQQELILRQQQQIEEIKRTCGK